jgi:hypothetical protein
VLFEVCICALTVGWYTTVMGGEVSGTVTPGMDKVMRTLNVDPSETVPKDAGKARSGERDKEREVPSG